MSISEDGHAAEGFGLKGSTCFAAPAMQHGVQHLIRCTIMHMRPGSWMYMGITQLCEPTQNAA